MTWSWRSGWGKEENRSPGSAGYGVSGFLLGGGRAAARRPARNSTSGRTAKQSSPGKRCSSSILWMIWANPTRRCNAF
jgi:hypothetical protein